MKIIIAGAGDVGFHLAKLLSSQSQDIYIIDQDNDRLEYINAHLDVITKTGDATSIELLKELQIGNADMILAVTESQNTNLTIAAISKQLGVPKTIARISNTEYLKSKEEQKRRLRNKISIHHKKVRHENRWGGGAVASVVSDRSRGICRHPVVDSPASGAGPDLVSAGYRGGDRRGRKQ